MTVPDPTPAYLVALAIAAPGLTVLEWCALVGVVVSTACAILRTWWSRPSRRRPRRRG